MIVCPCVPHKTFHQAIINVAVEYGTSGFRKLGLYGSFWVLSGSFLFSCCCGVFLGAQHLCGTVRFDGSLVWFVSGCAVWLCWLSKVVDRMVSRDFFLSFFLQLTVPGFLRNMPRNKRPARQANQYHFLISDTAFVESQHWLSMQSMTFLHSTHSCGIASVLSFWLRKPNQYRQPTSDSSCPNLLRQWGQTKY